VCGLGISTLWQVTHFPVELGAGYSQAQMLCFRFLCGVPSSTYGSSYLQTCAVGIAGYLLLHSISILSHFEIPTFLHHNYLRPRLDS
jgi:hypothetical protein